MHGEGGVENGRDARKPFKAAKIVEVEEYESCPKDLFQYLQPQIWGALKECENPVAQQAVLGRGGDPEVDMLSSSRIEVLVVI